MGHLNLRLCLKERKEKNEEIVLLNWWRPKLSLTKFSADCMHQVLSKYAILLSRTCTQTNWCDLFIMHSCNLYKKCIQITSYIEIYKIIMHWTNIACKFMKPFNYKIYYIWKRKHRKYLSLVLFPLITSCHSQFNLGNCEWLCQYTVLIQSIINSFSSYQLSSIIQNWLV